MFTNQNYPYLQKHCGVPVTEIATLKRAFFVRPLGVDGGVNSLGKSLSFGCHISVIMRLLGEASNNLEQSSHLEHFFYLLLKKRKIVLHSVKYFFRSH